MNMAKVEINSEYLVQLQAEKEHLDSSLFVHTERLLAQEIDRVQTGSCEIDGTKMADVCSDKPVKMSQKVLIPVKENPKFNFVGKLLGPKGNSLKRLQEETGTKMSILGRGSMRDKKKEDECRKEGGKYAHLNEELHVLVEVYAPTNEAFNRMGHSMNELRKYLIPDYNDEIRQQQLQELWYLTGDEEFDNGVAGPPPPPPAPAVRGAGQPRGRGGAMAPRGRPGAPAPRGRGGPIRGPSRGAVRGAPSPRGAPARGAGAYGASRLPKLEPLMDRGYDDGYGTGGYDEGYEQYGEAYAQGYSNGAGDTQFFDYGHGASARDSYEDGYGGESYSRNGMKAPPVRAANNYRPHPYTSGRAAGY